MKLTKTHIAQLNAFMAVMDPSTHSVRLSDWTTRSYAYTRMKALPPFAYRLERFEVERHFSGIAGNDDIPKSVWWDARTFFKRNKHHSVVLVLDYAGMLEWLFKCAHLCEVGR